MPAPPDRTETLAPRRPTPQPEPEPAPELPTASATDDPERYEQVTEHARGGLGRVVRAVDKRLGRTVAVKELLRRGESHEARFMREALITARLEHPGIVPVHEAGRWPNGDPYYVMKLVEGRTLKELITERETLRDRLELLPHVTAVADAVGYAHSEGVIHRDLKPSNVIVGAFGETIVVDWGLARDRKRDVPEPEEFGSPSGSGPMSTISGKVVGTPAYMSPEQARGDLVDERADVYAIGAVLYEMLSGIPPHSARTTSVDGNEEQTPQSVLDRVIAGPPQPLSEIAHVPSELATIVAKAMDRDPDRRYPNATALAEDLRRYQTGKLVSAHSYTALSLLRRKLAQHRGVVLVAIASAIVLGAIGVESFNRVVSERNNARLERDRADSARNESERRQRELVLLQAATALRKDPTAALAWLKQLYPVADSDREQVVDIVDEALAMGVARHVFRPGDWVFDAKFTPDGETLVAAVRDGVIRAFDLRTGMTRELGRAPSAPEMLELTHDGRFAVTGGTMGEVIAWPLDGGHERRLVEGGRKVDRMRFDASGEHLLVIRDLGAPEVITFADGAWRQLGSPTTFHVTVAQDDWTKEVAMTGPNQVAARVGDRWKPVGHIDKQIQRLAISPAGDTIIVHDGSTVWAMPFTGGPIRQLAHYEYRLGELAWSPDRKTVALVGYSPDIPLIDVASGKLVRELRGHTDTIYNVEWTRDGRSILSGSDDGTARFWSVADGTSVVLRGHDDDVFRARLSADERSVATSSLDGSVRVWSIEPTDSAQVLAEGKSIKDWSFEADRATVATATAVARWNLATGDRDQLFSWAEDPHGLGVGLASPDGSRLYVPSADWGMEIRSRTGPPLHLRGHKAQISHVEWSRDGKAFYSSSFDGTLRRWDLETGEGKILLEGKVPIRGFALGGDGRIVAQQVGDSVTQIDPDGSMHLLGKGKEWCILYGEFDRVRDRLFMHRCDNSLAMIEHGKIVEFPSGGYWTTHVAVSPDGNFVAAPMNDRTVRLWEASTGRLLKVMRGHSDLVMDVAFSPDGKQLASSSYDKTIRIWNLSAETHRVLRGHTAAVNHVAWRGLDRLVTTSEDGTLRLWTVPPIQLPTPASIAERLDGATSARIDSLDRPTTSSG
jgi:WD40 repeat protein/serine/threonine protein kinase